MTDQNILFRDRYAFNVSYTFPGSSTRLAK